MMMYDLALLRIGLEVKHILCARHLLLRTLSMYGAGKDGVWSSRTFTGMRPLQSLESPDDDQCHHEWPASVGVGLRSISHDATPEALWTES